MHVAWLWTSSGVLAVSPQQAEGLRELTVLLLCFPSRLWCLPWAVCCYCYMAKEDKSATIQWTQTAGVRKVLHGSQWWRREVWITWVRRKDCSILMTFFCLSTPNLAKCPKYNEHRCQSTACMFILQDQVASVQLLKDFFSSSGITSEFFHWIDIKEMVVVFLTKEVI